MREPTLTPCPFCGRGANVRKDLNRAAYFAECDDADCCIGPTGKTTEAAAEAWNKRDTIVGNDGKQP